MGDIIYYLYFIKYILSLIIKKFLIQPYPGYARLSILMHF